MASAGNVLLLHSGPVLREVEVGRSNVMNRPATAQAL